MSQFMKQEVQVTGYYIIYSLFCLKNVAYMFMNVYIELMFLIQIIIYKF